TPFTMPTGENGTQIAAIKPAPPRPRAAPARKVPPRDEMEDEEDFEPPSKREFLSRLPEEDEEEPRPARKGNRRAVAAEEEEEEQRPARKKSQKSKKAQNNAVFLWSLIIGGAVILVGGGIPLFFILNGSPSDKNEQSANKDNKPPQKD